MRIAIAGYGAVAEIHARKLAAEPEVRLTAVCGPRAGAAADFAARHCIGRYCDELDEALREADAIVIASPTTFHAEQALRALQAGVNVLVELPPCTRMFEAEKLAEKASVAGVVLQCAHTSHYLTPYQRLGEWIREGRLGEIQQLHYLRHMQPRQRSWVDDALLHHAAHAVDLLLYWFGRFKASGCLTIPAKGAAETVSLLAASSEGAPLVVSISYASRLPQAHVIVVGERHTVATDGFTYLQSDDSGMSYTGDMQQTYEAAIEWQDAAFLRACRGDHAGVPWSHTCKLVRAIAEFRGLADRGSDRIKSQYCSLKDLMDFLPVVRLRRSRTNLPVPAHFPLNASCILTPVPRRYSLFEDFVKNDATV